MGAFRRAFVLGILHSVLDLGVPHYALILGIFH
jgi:hypothetical protein